MPYAFNNDKSKYNITGAVVQPGETFNIGNPNSNKRILAAGVLTNNSRLIKFQVPTVPLLNNQLATGQINYLSLILRHVDGDYLGVQVDGGTMYFTPTVPSPTYLTDTEFNVSYQIINGVLEWLVETKKTSQHFVIASTGNVARNNVPIVAEICGTMMLAE